MRTRLIPLLFMLSLALAGCVTSQTSERETPILAPTEPDMKSPAPIDTASPSTGVTTGIATSTNTGTMAWKTYSNTKASFSTEYPADWTVNESAGINGELITTFIAPNGGQGITVSVQNSDATVDEIPDMPNTRCQQIIISGVSGRHCLDTLSFNLSTTFIYHGRQYTVASSGKHPDNNIYQHLLDSFMLTP